MEGRSTGPPVLSRSAERSPNTETTAISVMLISTAHPAPAIPAGVNSTAALPSTSTHMAPWSAASTPVRPCTRSTPMYSSTTTLGSAPSASSRSTVEPCSE